MLKRTVGPLHNPLPTEWRHDSRHIGGIARWPPTDAASCDGETKLEVIAMNIIVTALTGFTVALLSQAPVGTISGIVRDPSGAAIPSATIAVTSETTHLSRTVSSSDQGTYSFPALLPDRYEIAVEAPAFDKTLREASVEAGATTTADFVLAIGEVNAAISVESFTPQIQPETHSVGGLVTRDLIESRPLNSRIFIERANLE